MRLAINAELAQDEINTAGVTLAMRLREIAASLEMGMGRSHGIMDINGNTIGRVEVEGQDELPED